MGYPFKQLGTAHPSYRSLPGWRRFRTDEKKKAASGTKARTARGPRIAAAPKSITRVFKVADLFCGAGGSSTGCRKALAKRGFIMELVAVNHWPIAIETHTKNHPDARHYCMDLEAAKPEDVVPEGWLDLMMASPTCTYHSKARGGKPTSDQQRMDPWHVVRWCTTLRVARLLVENVEEFVNWGPIHPRTGKPIPWRKGEYFRAWVAALEAIGFKTDWKVLNAADYGGCTTRARFFLQGRSDGKPIRWPERTHAPARLAARLNVKTWRPAREIIDWKRRGKSVFDRKKGLAPKTIDRMLAGAKKLDWPDAYVSSLQKLLARRLPEVLAEAETVLANEKSTPKQRERAQSAIKYVDRRMPLLQKEMAANPAHNYPSSSEPFLVVLRQNCTGQSVASPLPTITANGQHLGVAQQVVEPFILNRHGENGGTRAHDVANPTPTVTTRGAGYVVDAQLGAFTFGNRENNVGKPVEAPIPGMTTATGGGIGLVQSAMKPFVIGQHGGSVARPTDEPLMTIAGGGAISITQPVVMTVTGGDKPKAPRSAAEPLLTVTTHNGVGLAEGMARPVSQWRCGSCEETFVGQSANPECPKCGEQKSLGPVDDGAAMLVKMKGKSDAASVDTPMPTIATKAQIGTAEAFVFPVNQGHERMRGHRSVTEPLATVVTRDVFGVAEPMLAPYYGSGSGETCKGVSAPLDTVTVKARFGMVEPIAAPFVTFYYGHKADAARASRGVDEPLGTQTTENRFGIVEPIAQPFILPQHSGPEGSLRTRKVDQPVPTITTIARHSLVEATAEPFVIGVANTGTTGRGIYAWTVNDPLRTVTTAPTFGVVQPVIAEAFIVPQFGEREGQQPRNHSVDAPLPAVTSHGAGAVVEPVIAEAMLVHTDNTTAKSNYARSTEAPLYTITTTQRQGVVAPSIEPCIVTVAHGEWPDPNSAARRAQSVDEPVPAITASSRTMGVAEPVAEPVLVQTDQQSGKGDSYTRSTNEPTFTAVTKQNQGLVQPVVEPLRASSVEQATASGALAQHQVPCFTRKPNLQRLPEDITLLIPKDLPELIELAELDRLMMVDGVLSYSDTLFRMLEPEELGAAMGFSDDEMTYEFVGTKTEVTKQIGNAVSVEMAEALISAMFEEDDEPWTEDFLKEAC